MKTILRQGGAVSLLSVSLVLGGCSLAPDYERPAAPMAAQWKQPAVSTHSAAATLLIRPSLFEIHAAYFTCASWKNFFTRSGDFSKACMWAVVAAFSLALVRTGTFV